MVEPAEREAQEVELLLRRREEEIALVAVEIGGAVAAPRCAVAVGAALDVVAGRQRVGAELARRRQQVAELDRLVAGDAGDRRLAGADSCRRSGRSPPRGSGLVVEHVMRDAERLGDAARIVDVLAGAAGALALAAPRRDRRAAA